MKDATTQDPALLRNASDFNRFEEMMGVAKRRAYHMALQLTRNVPDAEDLLQETTLKAWKGFDSYMPGRPFLNWLLRIMQRAYLDTKRRDNPIRKADSLNSMISPVDGEVQELPIPDLGPSPEEELFHLEWTTQLQLALNQLPEVYQSVIRMCDLDELSYSEIAKRQSTTVGTIRSRIHRGRKMLREIIQKKGIKVPI
ncbi:MAG: sigma-70 family RNA polymerase sigma factor [Fimbriimonadaceae bacterium]|nr:sigma-70 family RNA polymerase sigma factor [Fimbriimonadaceae bacterium]